VTTLVDLPQVERATLRMLAATGLAAFGRLSRERDGSPVRLVVSNYAFTELTTAIQNEYCDRYLSQATHGIIISNSAVFAASIRGRSDAELIAWLRARGLPAQLETSHALLCPSDHMCGVSMIHW